ncbi:LpxL/LpxP family Kdo(2)-lipid IV(A) lauroyl/palmitoleoyl acyltransferasee [Erwinia tracheiphila]|uniref:Lipid A biosynthesis acyltransferase n=1 Tax=Erwinia tracheiphila TaxID=65700 RepID=A0A0M2KD19_9GAMM|nr:Kdo(2)-lipid IV(A) acyltransferase [Erwinia tracheiphila]AXF76151.1 LpxL/LpxP family Kdo(2)-lipid IV(A) lauroyl/palmitoleoyl acyltransferase [Erwinia tracheiphila]EOS96639.1 Lipid A biosynthesis lauroyl acyltransferase [Erwinia tracheiphila PSU-1]KKF34881.1 lipid A biosynthesis lauroyl acyltransferase [Erwinia tracheiphila]UIA85181.1 LpxL/LpxP family Kdo(2)-lipid IV(A) lauroyl/palmitoleoyl acyltransferasee [Erwinia tracheiphila]UIA86546.1 LpxL/LpxP family Kdo(2)-lipid IV(A) lauroyl/palmitol
MTPLPQFTRALLHPRYWFTWLGIGLLYLLVLLPYPVLYRLGYILGRISMHFLKHRVQVARRNLQLCFPNMPDAEREAMVKRNFESVGMGLFETGMAWFWPDWRINKWFEVRGLEHIAKAHQEGKGVLLIGMHFLTLELGARIFGIHNPGIGVYRPNDNALLDWLQTWGRMRSNKSMLDRKDLKGMIRALKNGDIIWYAPDHDYGPKSSVFAPLFAVDQAASTKGSYLLIRSGNPAVIPFVPRRLPYGQGYEMVILPEELSIPLTDETATATRMNKVVEHGVLMAPEQYMWLHRRFKTRPPGERSVY